MTVTSDIIAAIDAVVVTPRVVAVDGIPMSGVVARAPEPRATLVAVHGGATTSVYFDGPGHPRLSLLRLGAALSFTVLAIDRPGFGASALYENEFDDTERRIELTYAAVDKMLGEVDPELFLVAHSNGCELALRMAGHESRRILGMELSGTGIRQTSRAREILAGATRANPPNRLRELLWEPAALYPTGIDRAIRIDGGPISPRYESTLITHWHDDFPALASQVRVPVRFTAAEHERVWESDPAALDDIVALFSASPRAVGHLQLGGGHNLSLGHVAPDYHQSILSFIGEFI